MNEYLLLLLFFFIALFYSSIGFGGGSSYLAILSLVLTSFYEIRTLALVLNMVVVGIGTAMFIRKRVFDWKEFWPFLLLSVPMAYLGARLSLSESVFFTLLGSALIGAALMMIVQTFVKEIKSKEMNGGKRALLGGGIGFLSGVVGIGGGIFLSPTLNLMGWKNSKVIASLASVFIMVNSLAGISGLLVAGTFELRMDFAAKIIGAVVLGGLLGSGFSVKMNLNLMRGLTAILVLYVGLRIVLLHGFGIKI
ncbi:MAG: sulfite exporter TauE/SafE family protein [Cyclobacteriaceae bacterium]